LEGKKERHGQKKKKEVSFPPEKMIAERNTDNNEKNTLKRLRKKTVSPGSSEDRKSRRKKTIRDCDARANATRSLERARGTGRGPGNINEKDHINYNWKRTWNSKFPDKQRQSPQIPILTAMPKGREVIVSGGKE